MSLETYGVDVSAPHRIATMTAEVVGAAYEDKDVDIFNGGNMRPELLELNPQHNIPVLTYKELDKSGKLYLTSPMAMLKLINGYTSICEPFIRLLEILGWANDIVKETGCTAGTEEMTIADIAWMATYSSIKEADVIDLVPYKNWTTHGFTKCVTLIPNYETYNGKGAKGF
ncbi:unnamed protein product [Lepeophtheirus salmonis]|uniref:(salmon louse) hypothetical protein n=1 Tax=Lepeophtheirus salmonis TaxID=72036 RepID=A0A7R8HDE0_LEPSM|nr:unnamed protein product [Lepeophtheirus salmonis]CAF3007507.1 unnamed protein product [Lepeophtheirus salmonis]